MKWIFNNNYKDYSQVEQFYPLFLQLHKKITDKGDYPYNSLFKGKLGIEDSKEEETAIYLLQQSKVEKDRINKINELLKEGYSIIEKGEGIQKFTNIVQLGTDYSRASIREFTGARIVFKNGLPYGIMPKGYKKTGCFIWPDRLIFAR